MADPQKPKPGTTPATPTQAPAPPAPPNEPAATNPDITDTAETENDTDVAEGATPAPAPPTPSGPPERVRRASAPRAPKAKDPEPERAEVKLGPNELLVFNFENKTEFRIGKQIFAGMANDTYGLGEDQKAKYKVLKGVPFPAKPGNVRSDRRRDDPEGDE